MAWLPKPKPRADSRSAEAKQRQKLYTRRWREAAKAYLAQHPFCVDPSHSRDVIATEVDHVIPHGGDPVKFWDLDNLQSLCTACHSRKTLSETRRGPMDGGAWA